MDENHEKTIEKITLHFDDGSESTVDKGFICGFEHDKIEGTVTFDMHFANVSGAELRTVSFLVLDFLSKMGILDGLEEDDDEEI